MEARSGVVDVGVPCADPQLAETRLAGAGSRRTVAAAGSTPLGGWPSDGHRLPGVLYGEQRRQAFDRAIEVQVWASEAARRPHSAGQVAGFGVQQLVPAGPVQHDVAETVPLVNGHFPYWHGAPWKVGTESQHGRPDSLPLGLFSNREHKKWLRGGRWATPNACPLSRLSRVDQRFGNSPNTCTRTW